MQAMDSERQALQDHVDAWRRAHDRLEALKREALPNVDTKEAVRLLFGDDGLLRNAPRTTTSGLVEQQALFARLRKE